MSNAISMSLEWPDELMKEVSDAQITLSYSSFRITISI